MKIKATDNLFKIRVEQGLTIRELALRSGVPTSTISRTENGNALSAKSAGKLCMTLNKTFEELFIVEE